MRLRSAICGVITAALAGIVVAACGADGGSSDGEPKCLSKPVDTTRCSASYAPTFNNVWQYTLKKTCASMGCHTGSMPQAGMSFDDYDQAYTNLLTKSTTSEPRVKPGDVQCGKVVVRLNTKGEPYSMPPPPSSVPAQDLCSIMQWIEMGAMKTQ